MSDLVPSYLRKISRAEKHLEDLKPIVANYIESRPYALAKDPGDDSGPYRIRMTSSVPPDIPLICGDFIYNIRSALDHLAAALNPPSRKRSVFFPIFWKGVWEPSLEDEDQGKTSDREKWASSTRKMAPQAIEILKRLQPDYDDNVGHSSERVVHYLDGINMLSNYDKHFEFPAVVAGIGQLRITYVLGGVAMEIIDGRDWGMFKEGTPVAQIPLEATRVEMDAKARLVIRVTHPEGEVNIPDFFEHVLKMMRDRVAIPLSPYLYVP
jgi:hypothetical protein